VEMKKPYDKYVTKSSFALIIGIVFGILAIAVEDKLLILVSFVYLGVAFYCMAKERKEGE